MNENKYKIGHVKYFLIFPSLFVLMRYTCSTYKATAFQMIIKRLLATFQGRTLVRQQLLPEKIKIKDMNLRKI